MLTRKPHLLISYLESYNSRYNWNLYEGRNHLCYRVHRNTTEHFMPIEETYILLDLSGCYSILSIPLTVPFQAECEYQDWGWNFTILRGCCDWSNRTWNTIRSIFCSLTSESKTNIANYEFINSLSNMDLMKHPWSFQCIQMLLLNNPPRNCLNVPSQ